MQAYTDYYNLWNTNEIYVKRRDAPSSQFYITYHNTHDISRISKQNIGFSTIFGFYDNTIILAIVLFIVLAASLFVCQSCFLVGSISGFPDKLMLFVIYNEFLFSETNILKRMLRKLLFK